MPDVFISYVSEDMDAVERLAKDLRVHGIRVWLDRDQIKPGQRWKAAVRHAIRDGEFFIAYYCRRVPFQIETSAPAKLCGTFSGSSSMKTGRKA